MTETGLKMFGLVFFTVRRQERFYAAFGVRLSDIVGTGTGNTRNIAVSARM
jgi:hypothetical protein